MTQHVETGRGVWVCMDDDVCGKDAGEQSHLRYVLLFSVPLLGIK